jgi:transposase
MMRPSNRLPVIYVCITPIDFRKGINGLTVLVQAQLRLDPFCEHLFVFCNRRRDKVKVLYWERSGFCLWQKRLEAERFYWPEADQNEVVTLTGQQLNWLLDGYDINRLKSHKSLCFNSVL